MNNTNGDKKLDKLLSITDKDKYNCFTLVVNGNYKCLQWLLTLNDDMENEEEEDEKNLLQKHPTNKKSPLLLAISNDIRKKPKDDKERH